MNFFIAQDSRSKGKEAKKFLHQVVVGGLSGMAGAGGDGAGGGMVPVIAPAMAGALFNPKITPTILVTHKVIPPNSGS